MRQIGNKVSYVKNPFAKNSFYCLGLGIASLLLGALSMYFSVKNAGQGGLNTGAYGFSSMAAAIMGLWYGILSFTEDDCNYILARIGMALEGIILLVWGMAFSISSILSFLVTIPATSALISSLIIQNSVCMV